MTVRINKRILPVAFVTYGCLSVLCANTSYAQSEDDGSGNNTAAQQADQTPLPTYDDLVKKPDDQPMAPEGQSSVIVQQDTAQSDQSSLIVDKSDKGNDAQSTSTAHDQNAQQAVDSTQSAVQAQPSEQRGEVAIVASDGTAYVAPPGLKLPKELNGKVVLITDRIDQVEAGEVTVPPQITEPAQEQAHGQIVQQPVLAQPLEQIVQQPAQEQTHGQIVQQPVLAQPQEQIVQQPAQEQTHGQIVQQPVLAQPQEQIVQQPAQEQTHGQIVQQPVQEQTQSQVIQQIIPIQPQEQVSQQPQVQAQEQSAQQHVQGRHMQFGKQKRPITLQCYIQ
jgi:hypothetical protein